MDAEIILKIIGFLFTAATFIGSLVWGYARLNSKVDSTKRDLDKLDSNTAKALTRINEQMKGERERTDKREDMLREDMGSINKNLSSLHIEVLKAIGNGNNNKNV